MTTPVKTGKYIRARGKFQKLEDILAKCTAEEMHMLRVMLDGMDDLVNGQP